MGDQKKVMGPMSLEGFKKLSLEGFQNSKKIKNYKKTKNLIFVFKIFKKNLKLPYPTTFLGQRHLNLPRCPHTLTTPNPAAAVG
jgi:hypothetical protein